MGNRSTDLCGRRLANASVIARKGGSAESSISFPAKFFSLGYDDLIGRKRTKDVANARQIAMYLLRQENDMSLPAIGDQLGGRDHSTVRYGVEKITEDLEHNEALRQTIMTLRDRMYVPTV